jgi:hypothetical protein
VKYNPQHYKAFYNLARNLEYVHLYRLFGGFHLIFHGCMMTLVHCR